MSAFDGAVLAFVLVGFAALSGCADSADDAGPSVSTPEGGVARPLASEALLEGLSRGTLDATTLLGGVRWIDASVTLEGEPGVRPKLEALHTLAKGRKVEKHHEVARLLLDGGAFLYAGPSVAGEGLDLVYFGEGEGVRGVPGIEATYAEAWNGADRATRDERLAESFEAAGTYVDPRIVAMDRAALSEAMRTRGRIMEERPDGSLRLRENPPVLRHLKVAVEDRILATFREYLTTVPPDVALVLSHFKVTDIAQRVLTILEPGQGPTSPPAARRRGR